MNSQQRSTDWTTWRPWALWAASDWSPGWTWAVR